MSVTTKIYNFCEEKLCNFISEFIIQQIKVFGQNWKLNTTSNILWHTSDR